MIGYDASVIEKFAEALYAQAKSIVIRYTVVGGVVGYAIGFVIAGAAARGGEPVVGVVVGVAGLVLGFMGGRSRSFMLRLQAQQALCQVQIERNTRTGVAASRVA